MSDLFSHATFQDLLPRYAANALADDEHRQVKQHLEGCAACRAALGEWRAITIALHGDAATLAADVPPAQAWAALHKRLSHVPVLNHQKGTEMDEPIFSSEVAPTSFGQLPPPASSEPPRRRWLGIVSVATVALIVVVSVALFGALHRAGSNVGPAGNPSTSSAPAENCGGATTTATLPQYTDLIGISQVSPTNIWASGVKFDAAGKAPFASAIYHLENCQWHDMHVTLPKVSLDSIAMVSANEGWAAGASYSDGNCHCGNSVNGLVVLHYTQGQWQQVTVPGTSALAEGFVTFRSPDDGWLIAFGTGTQPNGLLHYVNGTWQRVTLPASIAAGMSVPITPVGPNDVWFSSTTAYNPKTSNFTVTLVHWQNGQVTTYPLPQNTNPQGLSFPTASDGWMAGQMGNSNAEPPVPQPEPTLWHFNGTGWTNVPVPQFGNPQQGSDFSGMSFASAQSGVVFGSTQDITKSDQPLIFYHYQNGQWHTAPVVASPALRNAINISGSIQMVSPEEGWAFAQIQVSVKGESGTLHTIILHYTHGQWSVFEQ